MKRKRMQRTRDIKRLHVRMKQQRVNEAANAKYDDLVMQQYAKLPPLTELLKSQGNEGTVEFKTLEAPLPPVVSVGGREYRAAGCSFLPGPDGLITEAAVYLYPVEGGKMLVEKRRLISNGTDAVITYEELG